MPEVRAVKPAQNRDGGGMNEYSSCNYYTIVFATTILLLPKRAQDSVHARARGWGDARVGRCAEGRRLQPWRPLQPLIENAAGVLAQDRGLRITDPPKSPQCLVVSTRAAVLRKAHWRTHISVQGECGIKQHAD